MPGTAAGDNLAFLWNFWWARHALAGGAGYFHTVHLFAPFGTSLVLNTSTPLLAWTGATLLGGVTVVRAHNLLLLCGLAANGLTAYWLACTVTRQVWPSVVAGTAFASSAYISVHLLGHFNLVHAWVLPLTALAWISLIASPSASRAIATGAAFAIAAYSDYYYLVYATLFAAVWWVVTLTGARLARRPARWVTTERALLAIAGVALALALAIGVTGGIAFDLGSAHVSALHARNPVAAAGLCLLIWLVLRVAVAADPATLIAGRTALRRTIPHVALAIAVSLLFTLPLAAAALSMLRSGDYVSQQYFWRSAPRGIDLATIVLGNPMQALSGGWTRRVYARLGIDPLEQTAWLGLAPMLLLAVALRRRRTLPETIRPWLWIAGVFAIWALGPLLTVGGLDTGILLPQALARYLPIVANARMPGRALVVVQLAVSVLCGLALSRWRWPAPSLAALTVVIALEGFTAPFPLYRLPRADAVDAYLLTSTPGTIVELPTGTRDGFGEWGRFDQRALVHQMYHAHPLAGGAVSRVPPRVLAAYRDEPAMRSLVELSSGNLTADALPDDFGRLLNRAGIRFLIVNTDVMSAPLRDALIRRHLTFVMADGGRELYRTR